MGQAEALTMGYISTPMRDAVAFTILIIILLVRPTGIFGEPEKEKAEEAAHADWIFIRFHYQNRRTDGLYLRLAVGVGPLLEMGQDHRDCSRLRHYPIVFITQTG